MPEVTFLDDVVPLRLLDDALERGLVRKQTHPELPLAILNYTERAAYDSVWNEATLACRGLIYDVLTSEVVARPFPKFFNYGQPGAPELDLNAWARVTEKMDGSLGILYPTPCWRCAGSGRITVYGGEIPPDEYVCEVCDGKDGGHAIATRGSFASDQALHATEVLRSRYADWAPAPGMTYLYEIVYPENRIVCDYGATDDLFLLSIIDIASGHDAAQMADDPTNWPGPVVGSHPYRTLAEALAAEPRPNAEGLVVSVITGGPDVRIKIKQADYVALHRIVTGLNKRTVWEHIGAGRPLDDLVAPLPDEFRPWVEDVVAELSALVADQAREIEAEYSRIVSELHPGAWSNTKPSRKDFALLAKKSEWAWALFLRLDGRDYRPKLWRNARPDPVGPAGRAYSEDVA